MTSAQLQGVLVTLRARLVAIDAQHAALDAEAATVQGLIAVIEGGGEVAAPPRYVTAKTCPAGVRPFKRACSSGKFKVYKLGREAALLAVDFDAWLAEQADQRAERIDEVDADSAELAAAGVQLRPAPASGPVRRAGGARR